MYKIDWDKYLIQDRERSSSGSGAGDKRYAFESDFGRVLFCSALRRMHDKTQVIPLTTGDYIHTRLPHSMEVMNVAASLGANYCRKDEFKSLYGDGKAFEYEQKISAILRTAALVHDIGNPPFGHFGEKTIQNYFKSEKGKAYVEGMDNNIQCDFTEFDGNAQGLRVLMKLQYLGDLTGLNLTYGTLGAYMKYPNDGPKNEVDKNVCMHKHGVFTSEHNVLENTIKACNLRDEEGKVKRHPLVYLVEAADSICYSIMDIEDALSLNWISFKKFREETGKIIYNDWERKKEDDKYDMTSFLKKDRVFDVDKLIGFVYDEKKTLKKNIVDFRVKVIQYLVNCATEVFCEHLEEIDKGLYYKELLEDDVYGLSSALNKYARKYVFVRKEIVAAELTGEAVITGLLDIVLRYVFSEDKQYRNRIKSVVSESCLRTSLHECCTSNGHPEYSPLLDDIQNFDLIDMDPYYRLRFVVDWISGMTDSYALEVFQKLSGASL